MHVIQNSFSRRQFLQSSSLAVGSLCLTGWRGRSGNRRLSANERLNLGVIGVSGQGEVHLETCARENIVALCDVNTQSLGSASQNLPRAALYTDFREMLDRETLDGVVIATPDHTHAVMSIIAMQQGCHVYCADPLSHTISEARAVASVARRRRRITQLGGSLGSPALEDRVIEMIQVGTIGTVSEVHAWTTLSHGELDRRPWSSAAPDHVDYDLWMGPLFNRPYRSDYLPGRWRHWWHFGGGTLSDAGTQYYSLAHRALGLTAPTKIQSWGPAVHLENTPSWLIARSIYPQKDPSSPVTFFWYHGGQCPNQFEEPSVQNTDEGLLLVGSSGKVLVTPSYAKLLMNGQPEQSILALESAGARTHRLCEWMDACRTGASTIANFEFAGRVTEAMLLGNVAHRTDRKLVWDERRMVVSNLPEASEYIQHSYRPGWEI